MWGSRCLLRVTRLLSARTRMSCQIFRREPMPAQARWKVAHVDRSAFFCVRTTNYVLVAPESSLHCFLRLYPSLKYESESIQDYEALLLDRPLPRGVIASRLAARRRTHWLFDRQEVSLLVRKQDSRRSLCARPNQCVLRTESSHEMVSTSPSMHR
jgi:hypothetical protein